MAQKKQLGQILLEAGAIDEFQLKSALGYQKQWGGRLGKVLVENRFISEEALVKAIHSQTGIPLIDLTRISIPDHLTKLVPVELAENLNLVPVRMEGEAGKPGETLVLAMSDPTNLNAQDEVQFRAGKKIKALLASEGSISKAIRRFYHGEVVDEGQQNVFQMDPNSIQFGGTELSMNEMVVVKGKLESAPAQGAPQQTEPLPPAGGVGFEDPFAELDALAKGPEKAPDAGIFDATPPNGSAPLVDLGGKPEPAPAPAAAAETAPPAEEPEPEEDSLQELEIVEELPAWEDEPAEELKAKEFPTTPLEDLAPLPPVKEAVRVPMPAPAPTPAPKAAEPKPAPAPAPAPKPAEPAPLPKPKDVLPEASEPVPEPKPTEPAFKPAPPAPFDNRDLSAFGASGDLLGSVDAESAEVAESLESAPDEDEADSGIADREETIRLRAVPRPEPVKEAESEFTAQVEDILKEEAEPAPDLQDNQVDAEASEDPDQEDTITLRKVPKPEEEEEEAEEEEEEEETPQPIKPKPAAEKAEKPAKSGAMEALLSRVGIGNKTKEAAEKPVVQERREAVPAAPSIKPKEAKPPEFEDLLGEELGEELVEQVQSLLESIESGEIDEEPPQIAKASHLIATVIRLLLKKEVFSEVELLEELKRR